MRRFIRFAVGFFMALLIVVLISFGSRNDYVEVEFNWLIPILEEYGGRIVSYEKDWYKVYELTKESFERFVADERLVDEGFKGWEPFKEIRLLGVKKILQIGGTGSSVMCNAKLDSKEPNAIVIFADKRKRHVILHFGVTYGM